MNQFFNIDFFPIFYPQVFREDEYRKQIPINITTEGRTIHTVDFFLILKNPSGNAGLGDPSVAHIVIIGRHGKHIYFILLCQYRDDRDENWLKISKFHFIFYHHYFTRSGNMYVARAYVWFQSESRPFLVSPSHCLFFS